ncbi:hypothetical protein AYR54_10560 [Loigolactobacillus backii]|uniref:hypothetical protein n=1 Tax=Loigolactobacillus backii TaxID=375175 RepID=UPI0007F122E5|nr:hypothetical protein [Loigolactobacillus backii]ANK60685.1 hypothetical protein AYR52_10760 [Loigolactobacillus backii]ANK65638.1 hypothetical protein AYR54_10560 [Loigolactobacillus backii]ANK68113.1 hypothetical protein AYR55_10700 [Loigolactobacillus backii]OLF69648.1 hypothetical protein ACX53_06720 [Loigolactobacillus backii]PIO86671.1 hypothetical protein B8A32_05670 [Loigolactobacillus backii]
MPKLPEGIWNQQPKEKTFIYHGYKATIRQNKLGAMYGYVTIPETNGHYEKSRLADWANFDVHGGVTYVNYSKGNLIVGFDAEHMNDLVPAKLEAQQQMIENEYRNAVELQKEFGSGEQPDATLFQLSYKDAGFIKKELKHLIDQMFVLE